MSFGQVSAYSPPFLCPLQGVPLASGVFPVAPGFGGLYHCHSLWLQVAAHCMGSWLFPTDFWLFPTDSWEESRQQGFSFFVGT